MLSAAATERAALDHRGREQALRPSRPSPYERGREVTEPIGESPQPSDPAGREQAARRLDAYHRTHALTRGKPAIVVLFSGNPPRTSRLEPGF